jgi:hypothetical protein
MAVARIELTVAEVDWLLSLLPSTRPEGMEQRRAVREIRRAHRMAHESLEREQAHMRRMKAAYRTAPGQDAEALDYKGDGQ